MLDKFMNNLHILFFIVSTIGLLVVVGIIGNELQKVEEELEEKVIDNKIQKAKEDFEEFVIGMEKLKANEKLKCPVCKECPVCPEAVIREDY